MAFVIELDFQLERRTSVPHRDCRPRPPGQACWRASRHSRAPSRRQRRRMDKWCGWDNSLRACPQIQSGATAPPPDQTPVATSAAILMSDDRCEAEPGTNQAARSADCGAAAPSQAFNKLSGLMSPAVNVRSRPSPATCDVSKPRSEDHRPMGGLVLQRFPLREPGDVFPIRQDGLLWTCSKVLLCQLSA